MIRLVNHELIARLPHLPEARTEIGIHVLREATYSILFLAIAWFAWHGAWAIFIAAVFLATLIIDAIDEFVENRTRILPQNERLLHFTLILNLGVIAVVMLPVLLFWHAQPDQVVLVDHGVLRWLLSALGMAALGWALPAFIAWRNLGRMQEPR